MSNSTVDRVQLNPGDDTAYLQRVAGRTMQNMGVELNVMATAVFDLALSVAIDDADSGLSNTGLEAGDLLKVFLTDSKSSLDQFLSSAKSG